MAPRTTINQRAQGDDSYEYKGLAVLVLVPINSDSYSYTTFCDINEIAATAILPFAISRRLQITGQHRMELRKYWAVPNRVAKILGSFERNSKDIGQSSECNSKCVGRFRQKCLADLNGIAKRVPNRIAKISGSTEWN